jgi:hypothetical protein
VHENVKNKPNINKKKLIAKMTKDLRAMLTEDFVNSMQEQLRETYPLPENHGFFHDYSREEEQLFGQIIPFWGVELEPKNESNGKFFEPRIVIRFPSGYNFKTGSSLYDIVANRVHAVYSIHDIHDTCENLRVFENVAREIKASIDAKPVYFTAEEMHRITRLRALFSPLGDDSFRTSLEIVAAVHWRIPLVIEKDSLAPFEPKGRGLGDDTPLPAEVLYQQPFPEFPFLGFTQLWGGEVFSVAVDRESEKNMLRVVLLEDHNPVTVDEIYEQYRYKVLHVPDRFFRVAIEG